jgi:hypothetical protein
MKFRPVGSLLLFAPFIILAGCGGTSSKSTAGGNTVTTSGNNIAPIEVNSGPTELAAMGGAVNTAYTSVQVCVPGTATCQTIPFVAVDTGSVGLRVLASKLTVTLPADKDTSGNALAECNQFVDGYTWGPLATADIVIPNTNEKATSVPVQIVDDTSSFTAAPSSCTANSPGSDNSVSGLAAYAILGIGSFRQDCGGGCTYPAGSTYNPGTYYSCASGTCSATSVTIANQVQNPVALFANDNNGTIVELPAIDPAGAVKVDGSLVFGIGTQSNNGLGSATRLALDQSGSFTTVYGVAKIPYSGSYIDSGSNGLYFLDQSTDGIPTCQSNSSFYCPTTTQALSATNQGINGTNSQVTFSVANAENLSSAFYAFNDFAGTNNNPPAFDFGLPFFYGRNVFTGLEGDSGGNPTGTGQYVAY